MTVATETASVDGIVAKALQAWRPPPRLSLSQWADEHFVLSAESAAEPGRWKTIPYQRGIMDAFTQPEVERVSVMKSARVGWTKIVNILAAYCIAQDPCPIQVVQPTVEDAKGYSKEELAPMIRDVPVLDAILGDLSWDAGQTVLHKVFPGGSLSVVGANSGRGFRRVSRKIMLFDETDGYPPSAGDEGDQIKLGIRRTEYYWDRKIGMGSTPTLAGTSRIEAAFEQGDQRRYFVPCPHCGHMAPLVFRKPAVGEEHTAAGHWMQWPDGKPDEAFFVCQKNGCVIEHKDKRGMVERGEWRASKPFRRHASFHIWAAYSYSPNATWGQLAEEFVEAAAKGSEELKTYVNTVLGETWHEKGEAPDWQRLYDRREHYPRAVVPEGVLILTAGVDVQRDRLVWEVVGWGADRQSWSIDCGVIPGDPATNQPWPALEELLNHEWPTFNGGRMRLTRLAIDSGDNTQHVYNWGRGHPLSRVIATKGSSAVRTLISSPTPVDVKHNGKRIARGYKVWPVGVDLAKGEFYGWLRMKTPAFEKGEVFPPGWCHFPEYGEDYFKQITAEHLVKTTKKSGHASYEWQVIPGRENHWLDCRILARAAAALEGLDRYAAGRRGRPAAAPAAPTPAPAAPDATEAPSRAPDAPPQPPAPVHTYGPPAPRPRRETWLRGGRGAMGGGNWLRR